MSILAALVVSVAAVALVAVVLLVLRLLLREVGADGYGHRTPPAPGAWSAQGLPSRPYGDR